MQPYQRDSYKTQFHSTVAERQGEWVRLHETYFYPTSGGQLHDTGTLGSAENRATVTDVELREGQVWHRLEGPRPNVGTPVSAHIDWDRRYGHMQRHSAQHLLSQVFLGLSAGFETRSVSLRGPVCTLDLAGEPQEHDLHDAETLVNHIAYENLEIHTFEVDEAEIPRYPLRRPPKVKGRIRLVRMGDFELSACGGTHLKRTAEALPIKVLGVERVKGSLARVQFMAGREALEDYRANHEILSRLALSFSAQPSDVPTRVEALRAELTEAKRALGHSQAQVVGALAERLRAEATDGVIIHVLTETDAALMSPLARQLATFPEVTALLAAPRGEEAQLLFSRHDEGTADMRELLEAALAPLGGRGGGSPARAQGRGSHQGLGEALNVAAKTLRKLSG